jgi:mannitol-specific phosphotransferase system IIBC component
MKKTILQAISPVLLSLLIISCNSSSSKEDMQKDLQEKAQNALKSEKKNEPETNTSSAGPQNVMSIADAKKFIAAADANKGKTIIVSAYPRGMTKAVNGEFMLYVSDKTGTGLPEENFACNFKEDMKEQVKTHKAGELIKVSGNIAYNNGMVVLKNAKLVD